MKIGVVIAVVNLWDKFTKPAIDTIKSRYNIRIVLVDNGSRDQTPIEAMKLVTDNFHYKRNDQNMGVQWSWNYGIHDCFVNQGCDYVLVANNDVLFNPGSIDLLIGRFEKETNRVPDDDLSHLDLSDSNLAMVTCMNIAGECATPGEVFTKNPSEKSQVEESEHPDFSAFMINRKCWEAVGEFDEGFFPAYYEDNDYHRRIKLAGLKAIVLPTAIYYHFGSQTQTQALNRPLVDSSNSHKYFISKWGGDPEIGGELGERLWKHPFNDEKNTYKWSKQTQQ